MEVKIYPEFSSRYPLLLTTFMKRPVKIYPSTGRYFRFTWLEWYRRTCKLANVLKTLDVKAGGPEGPGDRVATMALTHHYHLELYYGVSCMGAVLHPINMRLSLDHMVHTILHSEDRILFFDDIFLPQVEQIYDQITDTVEVFVYISDNPGRPDTKIPNVLVYEELLSHALDEFDWPYLDENTYATLCYTTGTTGLPKGVMFTHRALYLQAMHQMMRDYVSNDPSYVHMGESAVVLLNTPFYHIHGWGLPYRCVFAANTLVLPGTFTVEGFCELVQTEKVTKTTLVPTVLAMIVDYEDLDKYDLSSLKNMLVGGAALPLGLKQKAEKKIPGFTATSGYGMTETAPSAIYSFVKQEAKDYSKKELDKIRVKTGLPYPGIEVEVVDDKGKPVPRDNRTVGEIVMRGPWTMEAYYKQPEKTAEVWKDGWFHSGDIARVDEDGYITIADRVSDMIRSGAEMVPTVLLENLLAGAEFILEATFVGVPDEKWGQRPMAIVIRVPDSRQTEDDIMKYLEEEGVNKGKITKWMLPDYVLITDDIPKTSVGKFNKKLIKEELNTFLKRAKRMK
jgi:fatty-acyl-CoA synthase